MIDLFLAKITTFHPDKNQNTSKNFGNNVDDELKSINPELEK
jgi:hypothetical protein